MLTALNIEEHTHRGIGRMISAFRRNRVRVEHLYCDSASVRSVVYEHRRGKISWPVIDRFVKGERARLLCPEELELPKGYGYARFNSRELSIRLCENAAIYLLSEQPSARVALIDSGCDRLSLCGYLVSYTDSLRVITPCVREYLEEADRILQDRGAVIRVGSSFEGLSDADVIIAPSAISRFLRCSSEAVILSGEKPEVAQNAPVIYEYRIDLPDKYRRIKPRYLDDMYFASALYSMGGAHELGSSVFCRCSDGRTLHTRASLVRELEKRLADRLGDIEKP